MKKNDLVLILALLLAAALLLGLSFYARSRRTDAEAPAAEEKMEAKTRGRLPI